MTKTTRSQIEKRGLWFCPICRSHIYPNSKTGEPMSNYWNLELNSVYCSPEHAMKHAKNKKEAK